MKNFELMVNVKLNKEQAAQLEKNISSLPELHIGRIFGDNCVKEYKSSQNGSFSLVMPVALAKYLCEPGNAFDSVKGLVYSLLNQVAAWDGKRIKTGDAYGKVLKAGVSYDEYNKIKTEAEKLPEYDVRRVFIENCMDALRDRVFHYITEFYDEEGALFGPEGGIPSVGSVSFPYYFSQEFLDVIKEKYSDKEMEEYLGRKNSVSCMIFA